MKITTTGKEDREGHWKVAVGGFAGAGKTLLASTANAPLFVFFQENPRLKSIANRYIPHLKLVNDEGPEVITVQDKLAMLNIKLTMSDHEYKTLVIDTGDELFQAMKQGRKMKTGGEFGIADWGWIGDAYRDVITGLIDLPMDVIVLYHIKNTQDGGEDGYIIRELMLQGAAQAEAPSWFDVVGALDTFEVIGEDGDSFTRRVLLTRSSRTYPWVKDHSGQLPPRFVLSDDFVGDFPRMLKTMHGEEEISEALVVEEVEAVIPEPSTEDVDVPTPEQLEEKKSKKKPEEKKKKKKKDKDIKEMAKEASEAAKPKDSADEAEESSESIPTEEEATSQDQETDAVEELKEQLDAEEVKICAECKTEVDDNDLLELTQIRFRKNLCREHFKEAIAATRRKD